MVRLALEKHLLAMSFMEPAMSRVISFTLNLNLRSIFSKCSMTVSARVSLIMATRQPFLPFAFLDVITV